MATLEERRKAALDEIKATLEKYQLEIGITTNTVLLPVEPEPAAPAPSLLTP